MLKKLGLSVLALTLTAGLAIAGGAFQGFPLVGGDGVSNCLSYGNNNVCNQYQPAGPSDVPPLSTLPADTNIPNSGLATVAIPLSLTGSVVQNASPLTGTTVAVAQGTNKLILTPAGTIAAFTVTLPPATQLLDGQELSFYSNNTATSFTVTPGAGTTVVPTITTLTAAAPVKLVYVLLTASTGTWLQQ